MRIVYYSECNTLCLITSAFETLSSTKDSLPKDSSQAVPTDGTLADTACDELSRAVIGPTDLAASADGRSS
jgi:hypothetical protein